MAEQPADTTIENPQAATGADVDAAIGTEPTATDAPTAESDQPQAVLSTPNPLPPGKHWYWGVGRRKSAVARVRLRPGSGNFLINGRRVPAYFSELQHRNDMHAPLEATKTAGTLDVYAKVKGGGPSGQAEAVRLAVARALKAYDDATEDVLRDEGFLTVDARQVERKKYGQPGARRKFQFSKR